MAATMAFPVDTFERLVLLPRETEWVEFKTNYFDQDEFGEYISALSNAAAIHGQDWGYFVFGVENDTHHIVGTSVQLKSKKVGNEDLEPWAARLLSPRIDFTIAEFNYDGKNIVLVRIQPALNTPVRFKGVPYVRVGSHKKKLSEYPEKERHIWTRSSNMYFESGVCAVGLNKIQVLDAIDYQAYFTLAKKALPTDVHSILSELIDARIIASDETGLCSVTNLGGILLARRLEPVRKVLESDESVVIPWLPRRIGGQHVDEGEPAGL
ncbi:MAG: ATP-binding protein [Alphaproteobacteria bacterium]|nr:ATP-binding protein [Alphaproteobacteria bacterium]